MIYGHGAVEDHKGGDKSDHNQEGWWQVWIKRKIWLWQHRGYMGMQWGTGCIIKLGFGGETITGCEGMFCWPR